MSASTMAPLAASPERVAGGSPAMAGLLRWGERLARFGVLVRGVLFLLLGAAAVRIALGQAAAPLGQEDALALIARQPAGRLLIAGVAVGLAAYAAWGVVRALFDPLGRGRSALGVVRRLGYLASAAGSAALLLVAVRHAAGRAGGSASYQGVIAPLPDGIEVFAVVAVGLAWIFGSGLGQVVHGATGDFARDLDTARMPPATRRWLERLGRIGLIARGVVFTVIGMLLVGSAVRSRPHLGIGIENALAWLVRDPFGHLLLGAAGLGLLAFGAYSAASARWLRFRRASRSASDPFPASLL